MFLGTYTHSLDSKSRLTIPAKYRESVARGLVITRHPQGNCLMAAPQAHWETVAKRVSDLPVANASSAMLRRFLFSSAEDLTPDKQGRILISQRLREMVGIENDVIVAGVDAYFELWTPDEWEKTLEPLNDPAIMNEMFSALGI